jgi:hypothetical protein
MQLGFTIEEITRPAFITKRRENCRATNPRTFSDPYQQYCRIREEPAYSFDMLLELLWEGETFPVAIWFPEGTLSLGEAREMTKDRHTYTPFLHEASRDQDVITASMELSTSNHLDGRDLFEFQKHGDFWYASYAQIRERSVAERRYDIRGRTRAGLHLYVVADNATRLYEAPVRQQA